MIRLQTGTYIGELDVEISGQEGSYICISGPADRSAVLDGDFSVSGWQGVLTLESRHHILVENLEIRNTGAERYGVLVGATDQSTDGCHHVILRNLHVHDVGEEIIKIQGLNTSDIVVERCVVHSNQDWSGIDVQGHWGGTPPYDQKPTRVIIRNNLIYDIPGFAGGGDFQRNTSGANACVGGGTDLSGALAARFQPFHDSYDSEYGFYSGFDIPFDFEEDLAGNTQGASWDIGAYVTSE